MALFAANANPLLLSSVFVVNSNKSSNLVRKTCQASSSSSSSSSSFSSSSSSSSSATTTTWSPTSSCAVLRKRRGCMAVLLLSLLSPANSSRAQQHQQLSETDEDDDQRLVRLFQETTASVVCIKIKDLQSVGDGGGGVGKVDGIGSGFIWDNMGHIVTNYHVVSKFAMDSTARRGCKVYLLDSNGRSFSKDAKLIGTDPANDLAVLKVDVGGEQLRPAVIGTSGDLRVGQSCFAIGNPYGYEHTLTTGVVSGLGREIPSQNGQSIRGAIQTDAAINAGNSGGPLIDSHGHVIGVNTATFSRKGTGLSSGVNFAIPVDLVVRAIPYLIVYGTSTRNRF